MYLPCISQAGERCAREPIYRGTLTHILTHKRITATFTLWQAPDPDALEAFARKHGGGLVTWSEFEARARPRLLTKVWDALLRAHALGEVE